MNIFPGERAWKLGIKLVAQRHGIVAVAQDEVLADRKVNEGLDDKTMFGGARNLTHVQHSIWPEFC